MPEDQTLKQKKIAFAQSDHMQAVIAILKDVTYKGALVGESEFETLRNAMTMDAQGDMLIQFIQSVDSIKNGGLLTTES